MILLLETATLNCSVALADVNGRCIAARDEDAERHQHAERLHLLIDALLSDAGVAKSDLTAIAVGRGPGSFTGLRIGTSAAKGMCAGLGLPLLAPSPLQALRHRGGLSHPDLADSPDRIVPALDARRMELFTLDPSDTPVASIVDHTFRSDLGAGPALLVGDGADKCREVLAGSPVAWRFLQAFPSAQDLIPEAVARLRDGRTESVADFEPFYLKDFVPGRPKDPLGLRTPSP